MRALELFCGIGGFAAATRGTSIEVVRAIDINTLALEVYHRNFDHPIEARIVESLSPDALARLEADLWWMSPPCQPFTRRGNGRDDEDTRSRGFLTLLERIAEVRPRALALENVPGFAGSRTHERLLGVLESGGYDVAERVTCPTEIGIPNRRQRFYLAASRDGLRPWTLPAPTPAPLQSYLEATPGDGLDLSEMTWRRYRRALDTVDPEDPLAVAACFTAAYGHSPIRSGSYLRSEGGLRRFSPEEILRLLGFPAGFTWPDTLSLANRWRLAGNSLSVPVVRGVLSALLPAP